MNSEQEKRLIAAHESQAESLAMVAKFCRVMLDDRNARAVEIAAERVIRQKEEADMERQHAEHTRKRETKADPPKE